MLDSIRAITNKTLLYLRNNMINKKLTNKNDYNLVRNQLPYRLQSDFFRLSQKKISVLVLLYINIQRRVGCQHIYRQSFSKNKHMII